MARDFSKNTANYMNLGANIINAIISGKAAISVFARINADTLSTGGTFKNGIFGVPIANNSAGFALDIGNATNKFPRFQARSKTTDAGQVATGTTVIATGTFYTMGGVADFANARVKVYLNGVLEKNQAATWGAVTYTPGTPTQQDTIGRTADVTPPTDTTNQFDGAIDHVALWSGVLTATDFLQLHAGASPLIVRPDLLEVYYRLDGSLSPERDLVGGGSGTITGTVAQRNSPGIHFYPAGAE